MEPAARDGNALLPGASILRTTDAKLLDALHDIGQSQQHRHIGGSFAVVFAPTADALATDGEGVAKALNIQISRYLDA